MAKELFKKSIESYKKHPLTSWILAIFCGLVLSGLVILCMLDTLLLIVVVPFILLPFLFACYMLHLGLGYDSTLTLTNFFKFFGMFFKRPFNGSFNFFRSLLKYLIASLICEALFGLVAYIVCVSINEAMFYQMFNTFMELVLSSEGIVDLQLALGDSYTMYLIFMNVSTIPASIVAFIYFVYNIVFYSGTIYLRASLRKLNGRFIDMVFKYTHKEIAKTYKKDFIALEWPLFVLLVVGAIVGSLIPLLFTSDTMIITLSGVAGGLLLMTFYLPFHFSNMETLYSKYEDSFKYGITSLTEKLMNDFQRHFRGHDPINDEKDEKDEE